MWYCGSGNKKNGVGIILKKEHVERLMELWRVTDRIICLKMELGDVMLKVIRTYVLQVGCIREEKKAFHLDLNETVEKIRLNERIVVGADLNGHVGKEITVMKNAWVNMEWGGEITTDSGGFWKENETIVYEMFTINRSAASGN